ncbi:MAG TPA: hypothetical protein VNQ99_02050 [Xanthobacteraceae bacterium]|nr:hypothetical protein [Xanthobacteraceae bacterium]
MLFHMEVVPGPAIQGWVLPNNPSGVPRVTIAHGDKLIEFEANILRTDLRDRGMHDTGMAGFHITEEVIPDLPAVINDVEIRDVETGALLFRQFDPQKHVQQKVFRFELQAMPHAQTEALFAQRFALSYGGIERQSFDTLFGILNNPAAVSLYACGRPSFQRYEQLFRERDFKVLALLRDPFEEMAERLLFVRYAASPEAPPFLADHLSGLEPLAEFVKPIRFDDLESIRSAFNRMSDEQRAALSNPLVKALACGPDEPPKSGHVEIALSKLARMSLVGLRSRFNEFKAVLPEVIGEDILGGHTLTTISWVERLARDLRQVRAAKNVVSIDLDLYGLAAEAVEDVIGPPQTTVEVVGA